MGLFAIVVKTKTEDFEHDSEIQAKTKLWQLRSKNTTI